MDLAEQGNRSSTVVPFSPVFDSQAAAEPDGAWPAVRPKLPKKSVVKSDISEPVFISTTSVLETVDLPPGASLKNGMHPTATSTVVRQRYDDINGNRSGLHDIDEDIEVLYDKERRDADLAPSIQDELTRSEIDVKNNLESRSIVSIESKASRKTFFTARSSGTWSYVSAKSFSSSVKDSLLRRSKTQQKSEWKRYLEERQIVVDEFDELNWSGRGQHAEFEPNETFEVPLQPVKVLGHTANAFVESVLCKRILLARKTVSCNRRMTREEAISEVEHLQRLKHTHIIQVVGTYTLAKNLSILLYPVAEWNLKTFLEDMLDIPNNKEYKTMERSLRAFFGCLSSSLKFIHGQRTKHLDIKPMNILVKDMGPAGIKARQGFPVNLRYKVIIADFGIARHYALDEELETDTPVSFTKTYAAPEVVDQDVRGLASDIFSLGCIFAEIIAALAMTTIASFRNAYYLGRNEYSYQAYELPTDHWSELRSARLTNEYGDTSYQANVPEVARCVTRACLDIVKYLDILHKRELDSVEDVVVSMLQPVPRRRPSALRLQEFFISTTFFFPCDCEKDPDPFEAADASLIRSIRWQ